MASSLVDVHVHLYPDAAAGRRAKDGYEIWEYGEKPDVVFDTAAGVVGEVATRFGSQGFDHAVVVQLFDVASERREMRQRLAPGISAAERHDAAGQLEQALVEAFMLANRWVVSAAADNPLLTAYVCVDPCLLSSAALIDHLSEMAALGARGVKLHPVSQGFHPADEVLAPLYDLCCELDLVVLSHSGPGHRSGATARPSDFASVLARWKSLRLVLAHLGGAAHREAAALARDFPQVVFDLSEIIEWVGAPNAPSRTELVETIRAIGPDRVMLGSDFPWYDPTTTAERTSTLPGLGSEERAALLGENARRLLRLDLDTT
jgi:uncharacterized protein